MENFIIIAVIAVIVGVAIAYIVKAKKSGAKCIGCPAGGQCSHKHSTELGCSCGCSNSDSSCECQPDTK